MSIVTPTLDSFTIGGLQVVPVALTANAIRRDRGWFMPSGPFVGSSTERGEKSLGYLNLVFGLVSVDLMQVLGSTNAFPASKSTLVILDLTALIYLFVFNGWFRNRTIGLVSKAVAFREPIG